VSLDAAFTATVGATRIDVALSVPDGATLAVVGPNGAGKTTVLRCLAGLHPIDEGHVLIDGRQVSGPGGASVAVSQRHVGMVFQDHLLFAHLDVTDNVAFGMRAGGIRRVEARERAAELLETHGLTHLADTPTAELSGGESQRVALVRALAGGPRLLLLDEPTAALDAAAQRIVRRDLRRHLVGFDGSTVMVTHDLSDAVGLASVVAVVEHGSVVDHGTLPAVVAQPRSAHLADLVGVNLLRDDNGWTSFAPSDVAFSSTPPTGTPGPAWSGTVCGLDALGDQVRIHLDVGEAVTVGNGGQLMAEVPSTNTTIPVEGSAAWMSVPADRLTRYS
jgi:molybdate transport system ATP-binding protein